MVCDTTRLCIKEKKTFQPFYFKMYESYAFYNDHNKIIHYDYFNEI